MLKSRHDDDGILSLVERSRQFKASTNERGVNHAHWICQLVIFREGGEHTNYKQCFAEVAHSTVL
jgi:hypothetical protein